MVSDVNGKPKKPRGDKTPRVLLVDAHPSSLQASILSSSIPCRVYPASSLSQAREMLSRHAFHVVITDRKLPDGSAESLIEDVKKKSPSSTAIVTGTSKTAEDAIAALRMGAGDYLSKTAPQAELADRLSSAIKRTADAARYEAKVRKMRRTVRKLSDARKTVTKKVDLLCNDLVSAYGEIARQMDLVRTREDFRKTIEAAADLEQLLCHAMDWLMRKLGYANTAVWLSTEATFQLGAYIKYTIASTPEMSAAIRDGVLQKTLMAGVLRLSAEEASRVLSAAEMQHLQGQAVLAANCVYLGESLAAVVMFRDGSHPFTAADAEVLKLIAPVFASALASAVKHEDQEGEGDFEPPVDMADGEEGSGGNEPPPKPKKKGDQDKTTEADWWKRGEPPPY